MKRNQILSYMTNPAEGKIHEVRFIKFWDAGRTYARVEFTKTGRKVAVPVNLLIPA